MKITHEHAGRPKKPDDQKSKKINIQILPEHLAQIEFHMAQRGEKRTQFFRRVLTDYFKTS